MKNLIGEYVQFCEHRKMFQNNGIIDLRNENFLFPTTLLPLCFLILQNYRSTVYPINANLRHYISTIISTDLTQRVTNSYIPVVKLPTNAAEYYIFGAIIDDFLKEYDHICDEQNPFVYVVDELVTNVYEHSNFSSSWVMAQKYVSNGFLDISFFDNGLTIPGSFHNYGINCEPEDAIIAAIRGKSTKSDDRGYGLYSTTKIVTALNGDVLIASGAGVVYTESQKWWKWNRRENGLDGTLITLRVPHPPDHLINFYNYMT